MISPDAPLSRLLSLCPLPSDWPAVVAFAEVHGHAALVARARAVNDLRGGKGTAGRDETLAFLAWVKEASTDELSAQVHYACAWNRHAITRELTRRAASVHPPTLTPMSWS